MEKIKSVLSGHKKSGDATHDAQISPTGAHTESRSPIYDQMTTHKGDHVSSTAQPTSAGTTTSAGQTGTATGFGQTQHTGSHGAGYGENTRPGVSPNLHEGISEASIKSGVIGFGANERQGHAALPTHEPIQEELNRDQILGGGSFGYGQTTADISRQHSGTSQAQPHSSATTHDRRDIDYENASAPRTTAQSSTSQQPFEKSLRQESYTADTDRSFPLTGGVTSKHHTEHSSMTHHPTISEREPGTKEREVGVRDGHGREGLAGAAAAAATGGVTAPLLHSEQRDVQPRGQDTQPAKYGDQPYAASNNAPLRDSTTTEMHHHPEALAAATAAAATSSTLSPSTQGQGIGSHDSTFANTSKTADTGVSSTQSYGTGALSGARPSGNRSESWRHVPGEFPSPTPDDSKTFLFYRDSLVPAPGAETPLAPGHHAMHDQYPITTGSGSSHATSGPHSTDLLNKADPRIDSTRDGLRTTNTSSGQYGGAVDSGSSSTTTGPHQSNLLNKLDPRVHSGRDGSKTVGGASSGQPEPGHVTNAPIASSTSTGVPSGQHELRHTGSLEQPRPRSSDLSEDHHYGRDAAIAGGVGAAGLGYAASHDRDTPTVGGDNNYPSSSPYSSKGIDPRVLGRKANLGEQRFDPQAKTGPSARHGVSSGDTISDEPLETTTGPHKSALLNKLDPRVKDTAVKETTTGVSGAPSSAKQNEHEHHLGRDAALVGAGGVAAGGAHHALQRNDTPGTGTTVLPHQQSSTQQPSSISAPLSSAAYTSHPQSHATKPAYSDNSAYKGPLTTSGSPFYGTVGAPAPVFDDKASSSHQSASTSTHQQDPQHHYGRDAGLTGAGLTAAGGLAHANQRDHTADNRSASSTFDQSDPNRQTHHGVGSTSEDPASKTVGSHKSNIANILDPKVLPDPSKQKDHTTSAPHHSDTLNLMDPKTDQNAGRKDQHHFGRDAAIVGGAGTAAYGVHEAADAYGNHRMTQPGASMNEQRYNPTAPGARAANPVQSSQYDYNNDHTSRNAAFGTGAVLGAGALGGAAYAGSRHADNAQQVPASSNQPYTTAQTASMTQSYPERVTIGQKTYDPTSSYPTQGTIAPQNTRSTVPGIIQDNYGSAQDPYHQDHSKRDAVVIGTTGAVAAHEKDQHRIGKDQLKHQKEEEKEFHRLEKEREKEAARLEKEREKEATTPEKKHGILSFLHRDKSKKEKRSSADSSPRQSTDARGSYDNPRHSKEYAALGASTTATAYDSNDPNSPRWKGKNRLHKDPPPGHPARDALEHQHEMSEFQGGKREHVGVDGPIGNPNAISGYDQTGAGVYGAQPLNEIPSNNKVTDWDHGKRKDTPY